MKILYGVVGEGMGHAMRSRVMLEHLVGQGHELEIMASGRAVEFLKKRFEGVNRIHGLHMIYEENRVRRGKTFLSNAVASAAGLPKNIAAYFDLIKDFRPEMVISDFESWTYLYAKMHRLPIISVDNMQILNRCTHGPDILRGDDAEFHIARLFVKGKLPFCDHYLITSFFRPPIRKPKTSLFPPILRPEILSADRRRGEHLIVYQTAEGNTSLSDTLTRTGLECRIYGMRRGITEEQVEGNLRYRPFSEAGFIDDLASARGVIAGGGFTLMGEAVYLRKPMLAVPIRHQFEQVLNARYLEKDGYGKAADSLDDPATILDFVDAIPQCEEKLAGYSQDGNRLILEAVDHLLDKAAAGVP
ncbi:MJ1255/VC2487 family glycosyltransferase [Polyangium aurulentum]|uniref:MJ1255/VC2487 family glycosyltransferase n=1 Tax=Polyangium aurulentum TaxID=2567896 RepID=UPI0010AE69F1|nr:MJ1255/VC2487 family glycosyltransferase [Polyangium aurulentum]UQA56658.1 teichoic acid biosynthesis protein [Polyangium aurulentum]